MITTTYPGYYNVFSSVFYKSSHQVTFILDVLTSPIARLWLPSYIGKGCWTTKRVSGVVTGSPLNSLPISESENLQKQGWIKHFRNTEALGPGKLDPCGLGNTLNSSGSTLYKATLIVLFHTWTHWLVRLTKGVQLIWGQEWNQTQGFFSQWLNMDIHLPSSLRFLKQK